MEEKICILCPNSCRISMQQNQEKWTVKGNQCEQGKQFVLEEMVMPKRILTTTVRIKTEVGERLAVRSALPIAKEEMLHAMQKLKGLCVVPPVNIGEVVYRDDEQNGLEMIACETIESCEK